MLNGSEIARRALHRADEIKAEKKRLKKKHDVIMVIGACMLTAAIITAFSFTGAYRGKTAPDMAVEFFSFDPVGIPLSPLTAQTHLSCGHCVCYCSCPCPECGIDRQTLP
jgi:hypothetical protein